jgi:ribosome biogenesis GTPase YqeH
MEERYQKYCYGCGAELQTEDSKKAGYLPKEVIEKRKDGELLCQRCFKLQHYGMMLETPIANEEFKKILKKAGDNKCLLVYVIDIFNFSGSIIEGLEEYTKDNPILIAINKCDILPKSVGLNKIMNWVKNQLEHYSIRYEDVFLVSSIKGQEIDALYSKIVEMSNNKDVYVIGNANVGKSSLVNQILKRYSNNTGQMITSSVFPGTTLNVVQIPYDDDNFIYDTPGLIYDKSIYNYLDMKNLKYVLPRKEMKPISFQLGEKQSVFIGSSAAINFEKGPSSSFIFYGSTYLQYHRTKLNNKTVEKFQRLVEDPKFLPKLNQKLSLKDMEAHKFTLPKGRISIVISGLVCIDVVNGGQEITVYAPKNVQVYLRETLIGGSVC